MRVMAQSVVARSHKPNDQMTGSINRNGESSEEIPSLLFPLQFLAPP